MNKPFPSLVDGFAMGLGFTIALTILGAVREILGAGSVFGVAFLPETFNTLLSYCSRSLPNSRLLDGCI